MEHRIACATCCGTYHLQKSLPCQDAVAGRKWENYSAIALADGAGSCQFSQYGAETVVNTVLDTLEENSDQWIDEDLSHIASSIIDACLKELSNAPYKVKEQSSTLLFCLVRADGAFLCGHIGDGFIFRVSENITRAISFPENGDTLSETVFVTSPNAAAHLRMQRGQLTGGEAVLICSDGAGDGLYARDTGKCAPAIGKMREWLGKFPETDVSEALNYNLNTVLRNESHDDMSVAILLVAEESESYIS